MKYYGTIEFTAESDFLLGRKLPYRNRVFETSSVLAAKKVRGALLTRLFNKLCTSSERDCNGCNQKDTCSFYNGVYKALFRVSPGRYYCEKCESSLNTINIPPLTFQRCKVCEGLFHQSYKKKKGKNIQPPKITNLTEEYVGRILSSEEGLSKGIDITCEKNHKKGFDKIKRPICLKCNTEVTIDSYSRTNVGISLKTKSTEEGRLFQYQVIKEDTRFDVDIIAEKSFFEHINQIKRVFLGRGRSRGLGWMKITVKNRKRKPFTEYKKTILDDIKNNLLLNKKKTERELIMLLATTPIVSFKMKSTSSNSYNVCNSHVSVPYIETISDTWHLIASIGESMKVGGWSYKTDFQKPLLTAGQIGSLFVYENTGNASDNEVLANYLCGESENEIDIPCFNQFRIFNPWRS